MKKILSFLCLAALLLSATCLAQDDYQGRIKIIVEQLGRAQGFLKTNKINLPEYEQWYNAFKPLSEEFVRDFSKSHRQKESFRLIKEGFNGFALAWTSLEQARKADEQYREAITLNDVAYAYKWKDSVASRRKDADEQIAKGLEFVRQSLKTAEEETQ